MSQLRTVIADQIGLSEDDLRATIPSGAPVFASRLHWAVSYMYQTGLVRRPRHRIVEITPRGLDVLAKHPDRVDLGVLVQFKEFIDFRSRSRHVDQADDVAQSTSETPPRETVAAAVAEADTAVAAEVLERVREREPAFLERLVLDLLSAMGYAGAAGSTEHTGRPGDKGLDGVISQDPLGLDRIYVQTKRYGAESPVRRPEIQEFVGALHGAQADRGIFITTSRFTKGGSLRSPPATFGRCVGVRPLRADRRPDRSQMREVTRPDERQKSSHQRRASSSPTIVPFATAASRAPTAIGRADP
jgi:restriction system protein